MILDRLVILVVSALDNSWSTSWGQLVFIDSLELHEFATTVEKLVIGPDSVSNKGLLVILLIKISLVVL